MNTSNVFKVYIRVKYHGLSSRDIDLVIDANASILVDAFQDFDLKAVGAHMPYCVLVFTFPGQQWQIDGFIKTMHALFQQNEFIEVIMIEANERGYEHYVVTHQSKRGVISTK